MKPDNCIGRKKKKEKERKEYKKGNFKKEKVNTNKGKKEQFCATLLKEVITE